MIKTSVEKKSANKPALDNQDLMPVESPKMKIIAPTTLALAKAVSD